MPKLLEDATVEAIRNREKWENDDYCKEVGGPSVNMTEDGGKNKHHKQNKGKKRSNENNSGSSFNKKPKLECYKCGKTGHFKKIAEVNLVPQLVCKDRCWFKTYEPVKDGTVLYMGDDHFALVHGKGSVTLELSFGKTITLFNVLYVPKLRKNLVSGPMLNKCGYKQVYESDKYILSKSDSVYMSSSTVVNSALWHARLGYVHYKRMLEMSKDDLIPAINENPEKCTTSPYTPHQNGVAEKKNRALKEIVNSMLSYSGLSEGSKDEMDTMLEIDPWFIRNTSLILKKWTSNANLLKEDVGNVLVWVKLHNVPITMFSEDGLNTIVVEVPKLVGEGFSRCTLRVVYEWKPPRFSTCKVFVYVSNDCPKRIVSEVLKNLKNPRQDTRRVQIWLIIRLISDNDTEVEELFNKTARFMASMSLNSGVRSGSGYGTKSLLEQWRKTKVDDDYDSYDDDLYDGHDMSENLHAICDDLDQSLCEVEELFNKTAPFMASTSINSGVGSGSGYGIKSLLEQWRKTKVDDDYNSYDDDLYDGHDMSENLHAICDDLDIKKADAIHSCTKRTRGQCRQRCTVIE
uniref:Zinc finger, CCHC-type n=1 Tax=Tanacetum cinerariifolium TaxID=118510 RepID=A0A6L2M377_TANCI|nr:hypothetical protein [Tanacetum cinerariifolium]